MARIFAEGFERPEHERAQRPHREIDFNILQRTMSDVVIQHQTQMQRLEAVLKTCQLQIKHLYENLATVKSQIELVGVKEMATARPRRRLEIDKP